MIVNVRGTFGSGKSHIVRQIMARYAEINPQFIQGRKRPYGYQCVTKDKPNLWVVGHYETQCGGADTIPTIDATYGQVRNAAEQSYDVIFEGGALVQHDVRRAIEISKLYPLLIITICIPLQMAVDSVNERRKAAGREPLADPHNVVKMMDDARRNDRRLVAAGVQVRHPETREEALQFCLEALGWA